MEDREYPCPVCGTETEWSLACPGYHGTWNGKETIMTCYPECGNADEYTCTSDECSWWYREPNNRRDKDRMGIAPPWLKERSLMPDDNEDEVPRGITERVGVPLD